MTEDEICQSLPQEVAAMIEGEDGNSSEYGPCAECGDPYVEHRIFRSTEGESLVLCQSTETLRMLEAATTDCVEVWQESMQRLGHFTPSSPPADDFAIAIARAFSPVLDGSYEEGEEEEEVSEDGSEGGVAQRKTRPIFGRLLSTEELEAIMAKGSSADSNDLSCGSCESGCDYPHYSNDVDEYVRCWTEATSGCICECHEFYHTDYCQYGHDDTEENPDDDPGHEQCECGCHRAYEALGWGWLGMEN